MHHGCFVCSQNSFLGVDGKVVVSHDLNCVFVEVKAETNVNKLTFYRVSIPVWFIAGGLAFSRSLLSSLELPDSGVEILAKIGGLKLRMLEISLPLCKDYINKNLHRIDIYN